MCWDNTPISLRARPWRLWRCMGIYKISIKLGRIVMKFHFWPLEASSYSCSMRIMTEKRSCDCYWMIIQRLDGFCADHIRVCCDQGDRKEMVICLRRPYSNVVRPRRLCTIHGPICCVSDTINGYLI